MQYFIVIIVLIFLILYLLPLPKDTTVQWVIDGKVEVGSNIAIVYESKVIFYGKVEEIPMKLYSLSVYRVDEGTMRYKDNTNRALFIFIRELPKERIKE